MITVLILSIISVACIGTAQWAIAYKRMRLGFILFIVGSVAGCLANGYVVFSNIENVGLILFCVLNFWTIITSVIGLRKLNDRPNINS